MKVQLFTDNEIEGAQFGKCLENFSLLKIGDEPSADVDLIILNVNANKNERSRRPGLSFLQKIRRDYFIAAPVIAYSFENLASDVPVLQTKGVGFLRLPFSSKDLIGRANELRNSFLTEPELVEIVRQNCGLKENWKEISHKMGGYLSDFAKRRDQIADLFEAWTKSVKRFALSREEAGKLLEKIQSLLDLSTEAIDINGLKSAVQDLDEFLQDNKKPRAAIGSAGVFPKCPPKGFSKVMIADDEALDSLISALHNEYNYVVVGQAKGINEAKRQVAEHKPTVILSDFYFKASKHDKTTDKKFGIDFMRFAQRFDVGSNNAPQNPIVAVISKTSLDPLEIPSGVLDCSGTRNATNPEFIHAAIWTEALKKGVTEAEPVENIDWKPEYLCRQRLEPYRSDLPRLIRQWESFNETVNETLSMMRKIPASDVAAETAIVRKIVDALEPHKHVKDFSFETVSNIFSQVEEAHKAAKTPPGSDIKNLIRNILHGKMEQFTAVTNNIDFTRKVFAEISSDLISLPEFNEIGNRIKKTLGDFSEKKPLISFLHSLQNDVETALPELPQMPKHEVKPLPPPADRRKINIIVVEDNKVWTDTVLSAIGTMKSRLGKNFDIGFAHFDNVEDALKTVPHASKMPVKTDMPDETKTIAVVDICLPENNRSPIPDMNHGFRLLKELSDYKANIPIIVFSTKSSLEDVRDIGKFGVADENFISKDNLDPEKAIVRSLTALVEKKQKYFIRLVEKEKKGDVYYAFSINGICIPFSNELNSAFLALYELRSESDFKNKTQFTAEEIYTRKSQNSGKREIVFSKHEKHSIQSQINEIRELIYETFRSNSRYIDVRELIKTSANANDESCYELNAELPSAEDEENYEEDYEIFTNQKYNVLVIEKNDERRGQIVDVLNSISNTVKAVNFLNKDLTQIVLDFRPDIVCVDLERVEYWKKIKSLLPNERMGIIVTTTNNEPNKKRLLETARELEIPNATNLVSTNEPAWINSFLTKLDNEKLRVFGHVVVDCLQNLDNEPIVEVLAGSDLPNGILKLNVNGEFFTMNKSNISRIIGYLLQNSRTLIPLNTIKTEALGSSDPVTKDDQTGWTKKIRNKIQDEWLKTGDRALAMKVLNSSEKGMKLNVQVIYPQRQ